MSIERPGISLYEIAGKIKENLFLGGARLPSRRNLEWMPGSRRWLVPLFIQFTKLLLLGHQRRSPREAAYGALSCHNLACARNLSSKCENVLPSSGSNTMTVVRRFPDKKNQIEQHAHHNCARQNRISKRSTRSQQRENLGIHMSA